MVWLAGQNITASGLNDVTVQVTTSAGLSGLTPVAGMPAWTTDLGAGAFYNGVSASWAYLPTLISTQTTSGAVASVTFSSIPAFTSLLLAYAVKSSGSANSRELLVAQVNGDTNSAHYFGQILEGSSTTASAAGSAQAGIQIGNTVESGAAGFSSSQFTSGVAMFPNWSASGSYLTAIAMDYGGTTSVGNVGLYGGSFLVASSRTSLTLKLVTNTLTTGCVFSLYGMM